MSNATENNGRWVNPANLGLIPGAAERPANINSTLRSGLGHGWVLVLPDSRGVGPFGGPPRPAGAPGALTTAGTG